MKQWILRVTSEWRKLHKDFIPPPGTSRLLLFADYIICVFTTHITYSEYFEQYRFYALDKSARREYITVSQAHRIEHELNTKARDIFWNKDQFLEKFNSFTKRKWLSLQTTSLEEFTSFCLAHRPFILKPSSGTRGTGIELITPDNEEDITVKFREIKNKKLIAEEYVTACHELSSFNPDSLNTIRVVTWLNGSRFKVVGSFLRMGVPGSLVDNAHAGGIFARIDVDTGIVSTEGINTCGERFIDHPNSKKPIAGFHIPLWNEVLETCELAARSIPEAIIVGWDVAVTKDYSVVIIEGNHMPDVDLMQSPARKGIRKEFMALVNSPVQGS